MHHDHNNSYYTFWFFMIKTRRILGEVFGDINCSCRSVPLLLSQMQTTPDQTYTLGRNPRLMNAVVKIS